MSRIPAKTNITLVSEGGAGPGAGSPPAKKKRAEARAQRRHAICESYPCPRRRGQFSVAIASILCKVFAFHLDISVLVAGFGVRISDSFVVSPIKIILAACLPDLSRQRRSRRVKSCRESPPEQPEASDSAIYVNP